MTDQRTDILLLGGGIASANAAAELRAQGFDGSILIATREMDPPYHRPPLTKGYLQGREDRASTLVHPEAWYDGADVQLRTRTPVMDLNPGAKTARLGREEVGFGQALLATGAGIRRLQAPGGMRDGIHYIRALGNADRLRGELDGAERVVVVGGSYIATEAAASMTVLGKQVTLVMQEALPLERGFGPVAGRFAHDLLTAHGIEIVASADVVEFAGEGDDDAPVTAVVTDGGRRIETDLVVAGVGANPDVLLARKAGLTLGETGGVACDATLRTSAENVFAAGDVCEYDSVVHGRRLRIEHEEVAAAQGRHAARAMLGSGESYAEVPYFWSDLADWTTLEYVGPAPGWDEELVHGDPAAGEFSVWYLHEGRLGGALAVGRSSDLGVARELLTQRADGDAVRAALASL
ncbi:MAG TPA: FAD-dependent oxidoreductase [Solirubrobacteraceae bacterium]|nr:FAD-dependent oxidoreductase [Solirubrobacteraceae bacterium]